MYTLFHKCIVNPAGETIATHDVNIVVSGDKLFGTLSECTLP